MTAHPCCCLPVTATLIKLDPDLNQVWVRDFYEDGYQSNSGFQARDCDVDGDFNVYQVGDGGNAGGTYPSGAKFTLQSWDEDGNWRWGWSEDTSPTGRPTSLASCRVAANVVSHTEGGPLEMIIVGTSPGTETGGTIGTMATAIDSDGNQLWRVNLYPYSATIHSVGVTRSLWRINGNVFGFGFAAGWLIMDNRTGAIIYNCNTTTLTPWYGVTPQVEIVQWARVAAMASDDTVYEMSCIIKTAEHSNSLYMSTIITHYINDGLEIEWSTGSQYMTGDMGTFGDWFNVSALGSYLPWPAGSVTNNKSNGGDIVADSASIIVSTAVGAERWSMDGESLGPMCTPATTLFFANKSDDMVAGISPGGIYPIYSADGKYFTGWPNAALYDGHTPPEPLLGSVYSGRIATDGSSVWTVTRQTQTYKLQPVEDPREQLPDCGGDDSLTFSPEEWIPEEDFETGYAWVTSDQDEQDDCSEGCYPPVEELGLQFMTRTTPIANLFAAFKTGVIADTYPAAPNNAFIAGDLTFPLATEDADNLEFPCIPCGQTKGFSEGCQGYCIYSPINPQTSQVTGTTGFNYNAVSNCEVQAFLYGPGGGGGAGGGPGPTSFIGGGGGGAGGVSMGTLLMAAGDALVITLPAGGAPGAAGFPATLSGPNGFFLSATGGQPGGASSTGGAGGAGGNGNDSNGSPGINQGTLVGGGNGGQGGLSQAQAFTGLGPGVGGAPGGPGGSAAGPGCGGGGGGNGAAGTVGGSGGSAYCILYVTVWMWSDPIDECEGSPCTPCAVPDNSSETDYGATPFYELYGLPTSADDELFVACG